MKFFMLDKDDLYSHPYGNDIFLDTNKLLLNLNHVFGFSLDDECVEVILDVGDSFYITYECYNSILAFIKSI